MKSRRVDPYIREQEGGSLLVTLVMITGATLLVGAVLMVHVAQYRFIRRDAHRLQARYAAEAGVYMAIDSLQRNPFWQQRERFLALPAGQESRVTVERFGGYLFIRATSQYRRSLSTVRALVGEMPPPDFRNAVLLWDTESSMHVAGRTRITGDVVVGPRGLKKSTFKRRRFTGRLDGTVYTVPELQAPFFDGYFLQQAVESFEDVLLGTAEAAAEPSASQSLAERLPSENPVHIAPGNLHLTPADSLLLRDPVTIAARGNLTLEGPLHFQPGSVFAAGGTLRIENGITGLEGLFYGRDGVETVDTVRCAGQFFSRSYIHVARHAYLSYPSVLYVTGEGAEAGGTITLEDGAIVDGTLIHPPIEPEPAQARGRVVIEPTAQVRGALFNAHETEFHGTLYGTLLTHQLYFYESPTSYINWLKDATIDVEERPVKYVLPLRFSRQPRLAVLSWETHIEEPDHPL